MKCKHELRYNLIIPIHFDFRTVLESEADVVFGVNRHAVNHAVPMKGEMSSQWHIEDKPYPSWALSNNNAEIRRVKGRIAELTKKQETAYAGWEFDGGNVEANWEGNRLQIYFEEQPKDPALHGNGDTGACRAHSGKAEETGRGRICRACVSAC